MHVAVDCRNAILVPRTLGDHLGISVKNKVANFTRVDVKEAGDSNEVMSAIADTPSFSLVQAANAARELYGVDASCSVLPSERDQNFALRSANGTRYVLKIANRCRSRAAAVPICTIRIAVPTSMLIC